MSCLRALLLIASFIFISISAIIDIPLSLKLIVSKFEVYDLILESVDQTIDQQLIQIQKDLYDIKATNSTSFECVELYGDLVPIKQLPSSFQKITDGYRHHKENILSYSNYNVRF